MGGVVLHAGFGVGAFFGFREVFLEVIVLALDTLGIGKRHGTESNKCGERV